MNPVNLKRSLDENPQEEYISKKVKHNPPTPTLKRCRESLSEIDPTVVHNKSRKRVTVVVNAENRDIEDTTIAALISKFSQMQISEPKANTEQMVLAPVDTMKFWVEALWAQDDIMIVEEKGETELTCSLLLQKTLTDAQLEQILKKSDPETIQKITYFNVRKYPCLGARSAALLLTHCPQLKRTSFYSIQNKNFYDFFLRKEEKTIELNSHLISHFSPFLKRLLEQLKINEQTEHYSKNYADVSDEVFSAMHNAAHILTGSYELRNAPTLSHKLMISTVLLTLEFIPILEEYEDVLIDLLDEIHKMNGPIAIIPMTANIVQYLSGSFEAGKFPNLKIAMEQHA